MPERLDEGGDPPAGLHAEPLHDPPGLDHGELLPGGPVGLDGGLHPMGLLDGLEPEPVVGQPVPGVVLDDADELLAGELLELGQGVEGARATVRVAHAATRCWSFTNF